MKDIAAKRFESKLSLDEMLRLLEERAARLAGWGMRESEYEGDYIRGVNFSGAKIRILRYSDCYEVEIWFDSDHDRKTTTQERQAIVEAVDKLLLEVIAAKNVAEA